MVNGESSEPNVNKERLPSCFARMANDIVSEHECMSDYRPDHAGRDKKFLIQFRVITFCFCDILAFSSTPQAGR